MFDFTLSRRRLLALAALSPLLTAPGVSRAATPDLRRIVALEWLPVELLLALGVMPLAVADARNYRLWVGEPALPPEVIDVGLRTEPNLELLSQLRASLIVYSAGYGPSVEKIERIAPGMGIRFSDGSRPLSSARRSLTELGERLDLRLRVRAHLNQFDAFIESGKTRFAPWRGRPILLMSLMDARHALIIGKNSLFQQVMDTLGLENAWSGEVNFWGSAVVGLERLAAVDAEQVVCFAHGDDAQMSQVAATPLWQAMPFVRKGRFTRVQPVWFYGATLSAMHFCRVLDRALRGHS
ncbi:Fe(3+)-hydroxamate ABC transporter substrate-binding protein FhuD [Enterobacteriaceae bacterium YMB-R22]|jgi:ABC-type Fe3+-hydroxamate transport system substrate-binding protein|uniref:Fe(3+)-hydroxamate ABC transporter substrate-binding protein FhuD n=1 Tax=Tenebrionicola larvae TaxID=2815733 RepID=UPI002012F612|nr:Fe(3+)-hydroxamate ABC transporter substrate-binding protein FhuD [Tenebrionicola larvae]MBV4412559.1 Fe(3+)-hydroxamate ABC transporter substrate-binding protein FhuD [Tenebrionicola larvae]